jgi:hypothetical protein
MAMLAPETAEALNLLLEEERAGVQCTVAFASGATAYGEREAFALMGREDIEICLALRERLAQDGLPASLVVSGVAEAILAAERYDERLRAFAEHQRAVSRRAAELVFGEVADAEAREILNRLAEAHVWHAEWAERHAGEFAETRLWENGRKPLAGATTGEGTSYPGAVGEQPPRPDGYAGGSAAPHGPLPPLDGHDDPFR